MGNISIKLAALHKHWCIADAVRVMVVTPLINDSQRGRLVSRFGFEYAALGEFASMMMRMSVWYSLMYVVIEGYIELEEKYELLDELLAQEKYVDHLRLFRNATFHYQENPISEKLIGFLEKVDSEIWIKQVNKAFEQFFLLHLPIEESLSALDKYAGNNRDSSGSVLLTAPKRARWWVMQNPHSLLLKLIRSVKK